MKRISEVIEKHSQEILDAERFIWAHPETGYREVETSRYMGKVLEKLGYKITYAEGIPGFYTVIDTDRAGPEVMVICELDSVICPTHKDANKETGAVHACGHNAQCAAMVGVAAALKDESVVNKMCGKIRLCAVPAEELLEIEYRTNLKKQGKIKYFSGKSEFLSRGYFDGVEMALMVHTSPFFHTSSGAVGCLTKRVIYKGKSAHAGGNPWEGKNALYAANCGLNAINSIRETFKDSDLIRVHPIITNGGAMVNAIPEEVTLESFVRGKTYDAIFDANKRINQALIGAALSLGTNVEIIDSPGYAPLVNDKGLTEVMKEAIEIALPDATFNHYDIISTGSTDMGDLSCIMPVVHSYSAGAKGTSHGSDYEIENPTLACIASAKWQATALAILLKDNAERAKMIIKNYKPLFKSKDAFLSYQDKLSSEGDRINYSEGKADVFL